ncbi:MAG: hypothetical protein OK449_06240 [Thaumarchaeota archaeon]|nr:hypothetical protein [Nitrososphaerota archaeon]
MIGKNIYGLILIVTIAWLLILVESYVFIVVIRPLGPPIHSPVPSSVLKVVLTAGLGGLWVGVMFALDALYSRRKRTPT